MKFNFNITLDHRYTAAKRWQQPEGKNDIIGMDTADMDYECAPIIKEKMSKVLEENTYNYKNLQDEYFESITNFFQRNYDLNVKKEWLTSIPGTLAAIRILLGCFSNKGDNIIMQTPYFGPLEMIIERSSCNFIKNPMVLKNNHYEIDFEDFEAKVKKYQPRIFILVNPTNPIGRVLTKEELERLVTICYENNVLIISDEVHFLITYDDYKHIPILALNEKARKIAIQVFSMSKGFNIMSLPHAMMLIADKDLMKKWYEYYYGYEFFYATNSFSIAAVSAATSPQAQEWLVEVTSYLQENINIFTNYLLEKNLPLKVIQPEASYLVWLDCTKSGLNLTKLSDIFLNEAGISLNNGLDHGEDGKGFVRINLAVTRDVLMDALNRIEKLFTK